LKETIAGKNKLKHISLKEICQLEQFPKQLNISYFDHSQYVFAVNYVKSVNL